MIFLVIEDFADRFDMPHIPATGSFDAHVCKSSGYLTQRSAGVAPLKDELYDLGFRRVGYEFSQSCLSSVSIPAPCSSYTITAELFGRKIDLALLPESISNPVRSLLRSETYSLAGLPMILIPFPFILALPQWASYILCPNYPGILHIPMDFRLPRWLGYLLYPAHLVLLIVLKITQFGWLA